MKKIMFVIPYLLFTLLFIGLFIIRRPGADFTYYLDWAQAFFTNDIFKLYSTTGSVFGFPVSQWTHGPGLLFILPHALLPFINARQGAQIISWLFSIIFWLTMVAIFGKVTRNHIQWMTLGLLLTFLGTPIGFYSSTYSAEILSYCLIAGLAYFSLILTSERVKVYYLLGIGALAALLIIVRFQQIAYLILPFTIIITKTVRKDKRKTGLNILLLVLPFVLLIFGLLQVFFVNRWMTGSLFRSPYIFGNMVFKSMDYLKPELGAVLFHSWHGLFPYHPFYALCFIVLILRLLNVRTRTDLLLLLAVTLTVVLNIVTQAAWYAWWLGKDTFGMRGLSALAILLIPIFIKHLKDKGENSLQTKIWLLLSLITSIWSYFLLIQNNTNFFTYKDLFSDQLVTFLQFIKVNLWWWVAYFSLLGVIFWQRVATRKAGILFYIISTLWFLTLLYFKDQILLRYPGFNLSLLYFLLVLLLALFYFYEHKIQVMSKRDLPIRQYAAYLTVFMTGILIVTSYVFGQFAYKTEKIISTNKVPLRKYAYFYTANIEEIQDTYKEYFKIAGFLDKKEALKIFLIEITPERL
jgi:hypothetical protein